jgi:hypothetical protein
MRVAVEISQAHGLCMPRRLRLHGRGRAPVRRELISAAGCRTRRRQIALAGTNQPQPQNAPPVSAARFVTRGSRTRQNSQIMAAWTRGRQSRL